jgi:5'-nucleotidase
MWVAAVAMLMAASVVAGRGVAQQAATVTVQLLAINDLHGNLEPPAGRDGLVNGVAAGGTEYLATHLVNAERENPHFLVVSAGDNIGASPFLSAFFDDKPTIEALNAMHLSVTSVGNHEFDTGADGFLQRTRDANFEYLAANVERAGKPGVTLRPATVVRTVDGVKIGFIGETLEGTGSILAVKSAAGLHFLEETSVANKEAARLEREGVHTIVLLLHQGGVQRPESGTAADPNGCVNFTGAIRELLPKLSPAIKVVISGHTHQFYNCQIDGRTVTSASSYGRMFTRLSLTINRRTDALVSVSAKNEVVTRDVAKDAAQTAIIAKYKPGVARITQQVVGSVTAPIADKSNAAGESAMGDVIADAQLAATSSAADGGAVIAFMNSGGIRGDLEAPVGADGKRAVTFGDLAAIQPFKNHLTVITMTGEMLKRLLEQQFHGDHGAGILQVSDGFAYQYKRNAAEGEHVVAGSMRLHGRPIAATDVLRVEASDFLAGGGDGMTVFREGKDSTLGPSDLDALVDYFKQHSPVAPGPQDRIQRVD